MYHNYQLGRIRPICPMLFNDKYCLIEIVFSIFHEMSSWPCRFGIRPRRRIWSLIVSLHEILDVFSWIERGAKSDSMCKMTPFQLLVDLRICAWSVSFKSGIIYSKMMNENRTWHIKFVQVNSNQERERARVSWCA